MKLFLLFAMLLAVPAKSEAQALSIHLLTNGACVLIWPTNAPRQMVQYSTDLTAGNWAWLQNMSAVSVGGTGHYYAQTYYRNKSKFFRLRPMP